MSPRNRAKRLLDILRIPPGIAMNATIASDVMRWKFVGYSAYQYAYEYLDEKNPLKPRLVSTRHEPLVQVGFFFRPSTEGACASEAVMACGLSQWEYAQALDRYFDGVYSPYHACIVCLMKVQGLLWWPDDQLVVTDDTNWHPAGTFG